MVLQEMKASSDSPVHLSIATDASNKGNRKLCPIAVRSFDINHGVRDRIYELIRTCLDNRGLDIKYASSYSAGNARVNYSVKTLFIKNFA